MFFIKSRILLKHVPSLPKIFEQIYGRKSILCERMSKTIRIENAGNSTCTRPGMITKPKGKKGTIQASYIFQSSQQHYVKETLDSRSTDLCSNDESVSKKMALNTSLSSDQNMSREEMSREIQRLTHEIDVLRTQMDVFRTDRINEIRQNPQSTETHKPFIVLVEGNIGSGKTSYLQYLRDKYSSDNVEALLEPLDQWTNLEGHNALALLYEDAKRWCYPFNSYALLTRLQQHTKPTVAPVKVLERSLFSTMHIFIENDKSRDSLHGIEYAMLKQWFNWVMRHEDVHVDLILYLQASSETCYQRIQERNRKEESTVPLSYIEALNERYENWLIQKNYPVPAPVLIIDSNKHIDDVIKEVEKKKQEILFGYG